MFWIHLGHESFFPFYFFATKFSVKLCFPTVPRKSEQLKESHIEEWSHTVKTSFKFKHLFLCLWIELKWLYLLLNQSRRLLPRKLVQLTTSFCLPLTSISKFISTHTTENKKHYLMLECVQLCKFEELTFMNKHYKLSLTNTCRVTWPLSWPAWPSNHMAASHCSLTSVLAQWPMSRLRALELIRAAWRCSCFMEPQSVNTLWRNVSMWWKVWRNMCVSVYVCVLMYATGPSVTYFTFLDGFIHTSTQFS